MAVRGISRRNWLRKQLGEHCDVPGRGLRQHAMPEIEYKGPAPELPSKPVDGIFEGLAAYQQQDRVEISLDCHQGLKLFSGICSWYGSIDTDCIDAGLRDIAFVQKTR
jgi:hypothetical protein